MRTLSLKDYPKRIEEKDLPDLLKRVRNKDKEAVNKMILGHARLTISTVNRYIQTFNCHFLGDELDSAAMEGLVVAVNNIANGKMSNHDNIGGYIVNYVHSYLSSCLRNNSVIYFPRGCKPRVILSLTELGGEENEVAELREELRFITRTEKELEILRLRDEGFNDFEISEKLGLSRLSVQRIRSKLKKRFEKR